MSTPNNILAFDRASDRYTDEEGRLFIENCPLTKATVNDYYGWEVPGWEELGLERNRRYAILRDPDELDKAAKEGRFDGIQLLADHVPVDADNPEKEIVAGSVGNGCFFDGEYVRTPLLSIWGAVDIDGVESGERRELSASYAYDPIIKSGNFNGLHYDLAMVNIRPNHVALVEKGRAGPDVRVSDALPKEFRMKKTTFNRFVRQAQARFANDADISAQELVDLLAAGSAIEDKEQEARGGDPDPAEDDEINPDLNVMDSLPEGAHEFLKGKLTEDDLNELSKFWRAQGEDEDPDADEDERREDREESREAREDREDARGEDRRARDRRPRANDADAAAIRNRVIREMGDWQRACDKVAPHIGPVRLAMDAVPGGAGALYRRALDAHGVRHKGITQVTALERLVDLLPVANGRGVFANDALPAGEKSPLDAVLPARRIVRS